MEKVYTAIQIKEAWDAYQDAKAWRVLKEGKWKIYRKSPNIEDGVTKCEMVNLKDKMSFPRFLETFDV